MKNTLRDKSHKELFDKILDIAAEKITEYVETHSFATEENVGTENLLLKLSEYGTLLQIGEEDVSEEEFDEKIKEYIDQWLCTMSTRHRLTDEEATKENKP